MTSTRFHHHRRRVQTSLSLGEGVAISHLVVATRLVSRHRSEFSFEDSSILRAGGSRARNLRGSKVLAKRARGASKLFEGEAKGSEAV